MSSPAIPLMDLLRSARVRRTAGQVVFVAVVVACLAAIVYQTQVNIARQGIAYGYDFLWRPTNWNVSFGFFPHSPADPYWWTLLIGLCNTVTLGLLCVAATTVAGFAVGLALISRNYLVNFLAGGFVAVFRNVPAILQVLFWYAVMKHLPGERQAFSVADAVLLSNRALYMPTVGIADGAAAIVVGAAVVAAIAAVITRVRFFIPAGLLVFALAVLVFAAPFSLERPVLRGFSYAGGGRLSLEFLALFVALTMYGTAFVGEIVRGGLISVGRGQIEAARALGLPGWLIEAKIRIPLGLRAILPALSNQHLFTMKLTSIGAAIGFSELFAVSSISINQTGQTIELLAVMVLLYFSTNYVLALGMHLLNRAFALKTRG